MYDLTNLTNSTDMYSMAYSVNELSNGAFGWFWMIGIFLFAFIISKRFTDDTKQVFFTSSVFTLFMTMLLYSIQICNGWHLGTAIGLLLAGIIGYSMSGE